jgi:multidrug efflux pump subunit AcrB
MRAPLEYPLTESRQHPAETCNPAKPMSAIARPSVSHPPNDWLKTAPLAILSSALLSTSGVFIALIVTRTTFNISSFMGMIMVIGIVAKNGILLLDADQKFRATGLSIEDAMIQASRRRLRPIVMTALASVAGMLPLAFAIGAGSQMLQPLAIAVIGGILISMVPSLIITPAVHFYLSWEERKQELSLTGLGPLES